MFMTDNSDGFEVPDIFTIQPNRKQIEDSNLAGYKVYETPALGSFRMRNLKYSEIRLLNTFNSDDMDRVIDDLILATTDLTLDSLRHMPDIDRDYIALLLRAQSFIDTKFDVTLKCDQCEDEGNFVNRKFEISEFPFIPPEGSFFEPVIHENMKVTCAVRPYGSKLILKGLPEGIEEFKLELLTIASYVSLITVDNVTMELPEAIADRLAIVAEFLETNGLMAEKLIDKLSTVTFGLQGKTTEWTCPTCKHKHVTEVDPESFFSYQPSI